MAGRERATPESRLSLVPGLTTYASDSSKKLYFQPLDTIAKILICSRNIHKMERREGGGPFALLGSETTPTGTERAVLGISGLTDAHRHDAHRHYWG